MTLRTTMGTVTELIGGPLDGQEIDLDCEIDKTLDSIRLTWSLEDCFDPQPIVKYKVKHWRDRGLALVFDGYGDE